MVVFVLVVAADCLQNQPAFRYRHTHCSGSCVKLGFACAGGEIHATSRGPCGSWNPSGARTLRFVVLTTRHYGCDRIADGVVVVVELLPR